MGRNLRWTAGVVAMITLAACGSSAAKSSDRPAKVDISTWRAGTESGTARIVERSTTVTPGNADRVQVSEGAVDFDRHRYTSTSRITSGPNAGREFGTRQIDDTIYWWDPSPDGPGGTAKPWSRAALPWQAGAWKATLDRALGDPTVTVTRTGDDTVRGEPVTNYRVDSSAGIPPRLLERGYPKGLTDLEIAVDADQRVRRVRYSLQTTTDAHTRTEIEFYDIGTPVTVDPPPADQIDTSGTSADVPVATGAWTDLATDGVGADRVVVRAVPTQDGTCVRFEGVPDRNEWWVVDGQATFTCMAAGDAMFSAGEVSVYPISTDLQIIAGQFDRAATAVTLRLDDETSRKVTPTGGAFAAIIRGNRVVEGVEAEGPAVQNACDFAPARSPFIYSCSGTTGGPPEGLPTAIPSTPTTTPGG